jgi:4-amino-4-deoxy-L-arabinose transferase-like glycosyltransferase
MGSAEGEMAAPPARAADAEKAAQDVHARDWPRRWAGPGLCAVAFLVMAAISWRKWPDLLIDFGHELYIPWQLASGKVLYRDIAFLFGPFSQYLNAFWFKLFGVSLSTLVFCNLAILAGMTILIYRLLVEATDRLTATAASLTLLLVFAFAQYMMIGNYNYVCPYSHEATHGVALTVAMIFCLSRAELRRRRLMHILAGICCGFALLTKAETSLAACAVAIVWLVLGLLVRPQRSRVDVRAVFGFLVAAAVPVVGFFLWFWSKMPAVLALKGVASAWTVPLSSSAAHNLFHEQGMGLDDVRGNLLLALAVFGGIALAVIAAGGADVATRRLAAGRAVVGLAWEALCSPRCCAGLR